MAPSSNGRAELRVSNLQLCKEIVDPPNFLPKIFGHPIQQNVTSPCQHYREMALKRKRPANRQEDTSNKRHRFRSFSERIDNLNIDVVRKVRPVIPESGVDDEDAYVFSYLTESVNKWKDLNLSATYTEFHRQISPMSESLPQVIHHQDKIMVLLEEYIQRQDALALVSLLDILLQFARDLDEDFYLKFWVRTLAMLSQTVNHTDFSIIEAAFNTLSWLLKYLSRRLVTNLPLTFHQLAPLLGKTHQKTYVRRFTSEAFAFLLRRVKDPSEIVDLILSDLDGNEEYSEALTNVFVESMKGPRQTLHSKALTMFNVLVEYVHASANDLARHVLVDVLKELLSDTSVTHFSPIYDRILELFSGQDCDLAIQLLLICCQVKNGSKIKDWATIISPLSNIISAKGLESKQICVLASVVAAKADVISSKTITQKIFQAAKEKKSRRVSVFLQLVQKFNDSRFENWVEDFVKFVNLSDEDLFETVVLDLLALEDSSISSSHGIRNRRLNRYSVRDDSKFVKALTERIMSFTSDISDNLEPSALWGYLRIVEVLELNSSAVENFIDDLLLRMLKINERSHPSVIGLMLSTCSANDLCENDFLDMLASRIEHLSKDVGFLEGFEKFIHKISTSETGLHQIRSLVSGPLIQNLSYPSHMIRLISLRILSTTYAFMSSHELINAMLNIEATPCTVENIRSISMAIRRLPLLSPPEHDEMMIAFCLGLLTINFSPVWPEACGVLKAVADRSGAKIWKIIFPQVISDQNFTSEGISARHETKEHSVEQFIDALWNESQLEFKDRLQHLYNSATARNIPDSRASPRTQALQALLGVPQLAEQHSRDLVPLFLSLEDPSAESPIQWLRNDRISLLTLFTKFANPRALYKTSQVRSTLYTLLHHGDHKVQALALNAILTWKDAGLTTYQEDLHNLLDEKKFREALTTLVHIDEEDSSIQEGHRKALMELIVRILYGKASVKQANDGKRTAILSALVNLRPEESRIFVDLALLPFEKNKRALEEAGNTYIINAEKVSYPIQERKMLGFVMMAQNMVKAFGGYIKPYMHDLLEALIVCMWKSKLSSTAAEDIQDEGDVELILDDHHAKASRSIRKASMKVFNLLINTCPDFAWDRYVSLVFREYIRPRLGRLAYENIQLPSSRLQFFESLSRNRQTVLLLSQDNGQIIDGLLQCLQNAAASTTVFEMSFQIFTNIFNYSGDDDLGDAVKERLILNHLTSLLECLTKILTDDRFQHVVNTKQTLDLLVKVVQRATLLVETKSLAKHLIEPLISLLGKSPKVVSDKVKSSLLESVANLLPLCDDFRADSSTFEPRLVSVSRFFGSLSDRNTRVTLCQILNLFAEVDMSLQKIKDVVANLNAYDGRRLDVPDFDRRLAAFAKLNEELHSTLSARAWTPLIYNMLYFVRDTEEISLRTGASFSLERFFCAVQANNLSSDFTRLLTSAVFPAIKKGVTHSNEFVRKEYTGVLNSLVKTCGEWAPISDLKILLVDGDEEANFFNNIYHIQQHRQLRAINRLSKAAADGVLKSANIEQIFIPMLEIFTLDSSTEAHNQALEATRAIGILSGGLGWKAYRQLVKRYLSLMKTGDEKERVIVRMVCAIVEQGRKVAQARVQRIAEQTDLDDGEDENAEDTTHDDFFVRAFVGEFLPPMLQYLHRHEDSTITLRAPVAIALVKILLALPDKFMVSKLPTVLTDVCHILRSRSQEARDTCRKTLNEIMSLIGPRFFSFVLKELKTALSRGYQLHVLGYTVHSLLAHLPANFGDLDGCVSDIVDLLIDDVFGATGLEKESEDYISSMKEVKSNKSYDSFEILASITSIGQMSSLLGPLKSFLSKMGSVKDGRKMNEVLRRIQLGIMRSKGATPPATLDFCVSIFKDTQTEMIGSENTKDMPLHNQFIVDLKFKRNYEANHFKANAPKLLRFALDTIASLLRKYEYLVKEENVAHLVPILGDCLVSDIDELRIPALRLLGRIVSLPIASVEEGVDVFLDQALRYIKESPLTKSELCQASLKFLSLLLRDRKSFIPPDNIIIYLLERIRPDLEEPDRQGVSFSLIRAILSRRLIIPEVYDIMIPISNIMITNQSNAVRDATRALYLQFLLDYPQGRDRLKKQISFLVKNLQYEHESGRQSVMEVLHQIISKFGDELLQPIILDLFVGLLLPLANDESKTCREMASRLIGSLIENADEERSKAIRTMTRLWANQGDKASLLKATLHVYRILLEQGSKDAEDADFCIECVKSIISSNSNGMKSTPMWEIIDGALQLLIELSKKFPDRVFAAEKGDMWIMIRNALASESTSIRLLSAKLYGIVFARSESFDNGDLKVESVTLTVQNLIALAREFLVQIKSEQSTAQIGLQAVKDLVFLGRHFYQTGCNLPRKHDAVGNSMETNVQTCFMWLISRVAAEIRYERVVAEHIGIARKLFVQWMVAMINIIDSKDLSIYAESFVTSLSRFTDEAPQASILKSSAKETREIAEEGLKLIQSKIGTTPYLEYVNSARRHTLEKRNERKIKRSIALVADPAKAAEKKIRKHQKAKESRKRKVAELKNRRRVFGR